jgi:hypothetical protein
MLSLAVQVAGALVRALAVGHGQDGTRWIARLLELSRTRTQNPELYTSLVEDLDNDSRALAGAREDRPLVADGLTNKWTHRLSDQLRVDPKLTSALLELLESAVPSSGTLHVDGGGGVAAGTIYGQVSVKDAPNVNENTEEPPDVVGPP